MQRGEGYSMRMISQDESKLYDCPKEDWVGGSNFRRYVAKAEEACVPMGELGDGLCQPKDRLMILQEKHEIDHLWIPTFSSR